MLRLGAVAVLLWAAVAVRAQVDFRCSDAYCQDYLETTGCPTLPENCTEAFFEKYPDEGILMPSPTVCNCCKLCIKYLPLGNECVIGKSGQPVPTAICGAGLMCVKVNPTDLSPHCVRLDTPCMKGQLDWDKRREDGTLGSAEVRPECDAKGQYQPAHCIPGFTCYCVDPVDGIRIFGESPFTSTSTPTDMRCPCSVSLWRANQVFSEEEEGTRCLPDGRYDELQCVDNKCFCVDSEDAVLQGTGLVHVGDISPDTLPCFNPELHTAGMYLKPCEDERLKVRQSLEVLALDGIFAIGLREPNCDKDGHYSKLQTPGSTKICVDPNNNKIEEFEVSSALPEAKNMDCNCARTRWLMTTTADESHVQDLPTCCTNGNFAAWQCRRGSCYCTDHDGNQFGLEDRDASNLPCYDKEGVCAIYTK